MARDTDAADALGEGGSPEADRQLAENFGMTVRQLREFDPQLLDVTRACKFLGLPLKRFDQLASQAGARARWVESVAKQKKDLIETFPEAGKEIREMLEAIRKFALRKCLKPDGPALTGGSVGGADKSNRPQSVRTGLLIGVGATAVVLLACGVVVMLMLPRGGTDKQVKAPPSVADRPSPLRAGAPEAVSGEKASRRQDDQPTGTQKEPGLSPKKGEILGDGRNQPMWTPLFNGKDLAGWRAVGMEKRDTRWEVVDGVLMGSGPPGFLVTEKTDYTQFRFRAEVRCEAICNSGQVFRYRNKNDFYEADLFGQETGSILLARNGRFFPKHAVTGSPFTAGKWFVQEVEVLNGTITVSIDGTKVAVYNRPAEVAGEGAVGVQVWPSPGGGTYPVSFRRLEIQDLGVAK